MLTPIQIAVAFLRYYPIQHIRTTRGRCQQHANTIYRALWATIYYMLNIVYTTHYSWLVSTCLRNVHLAAAHTFHNAITAKLPPNRANIVLRSARCIVHIYLCYGRGSQSREARAVCLFWSRISCASDNASPDMDIGLTYRRASHVFCRHWRGAGLRFVLLYVRVKSVHQMLTTALICSCLNAYFYFF